MADEHDDSDNSWTLHLGSRTFRVSWHDLNRCCRTVAWWTLWVIIGSGAFAGLEYSEAINVLGLFGP